MSTTYTEPAVGNPAQKDLHGNWKRVTESVGDLSSLASFPPTSPSKSESDRPFPSPSSVTSLTVSPPLRSVASKQRTKITSSRPMPLSQWVYASDLATKPVRKVQRPPTSSCSLFSSEQPTVSTLSTIASTVADLLSDHTQPHINFDGANPSTISTYSTPIQTSVGVYDSQDDGYYTQQLQLHQFSGNPRTGEGMDSGDWRARQQHQDSILLMHLDEEEEGYVASPCWTLT